MARTSQKTKVAKVPKLRFPGFDGEWEKIELGDVFHEREERKDDLTKEMLSVTTNHGIVKQSTLTKKDSSSEDKSRYKVVQEGDIVYNTMRMWQGASGLSVYNGIVSPAYTVTTLYRGNNTFYSYQFKRKRVIFDFYRYSQGLTSDTWNLKFRHFSKVNLIVPPEIEEQERIARFLSKADELIENLQTQKVLLEKYKKGVMQKIFSQQLRLKDRNGENYPDWVGKRLVEIGKIYNGLVGKSADDFGAGESFITYKQIFDKSEIDISNFGFVKVSETEKQNRVVFGDVLFTTSSETPLEVGFASVLLSKEYTPFLNSFSFGFRPNDNLVPNYAKYLFRSSVYRKEVIKLAQGSTRFNISKVEFLKIKLFLPGVQEQLEISKFLLFFDKQIECKLQEISSVEVWKKGLMQNLFI